MAIPSIYLSQQSSITEMTRTPAISSDDEHEYYWTGEQQTPNISTPTVRAEYWTMMSHDSANVRKGQWRPVDTDRMTGRAFPPATVKPFGELAWISDRLEENRRVLYMKQSVSAHLLSDFTMSRHE
jgi:hypothetical protein